MMVALCVLTGTSLPQVRPALAPVNRFIVSPDSGGRFLTIEAEVNGASGPFVLKDFGQLKSIRWFFGGKERAVPADRKNDILVFRPWTHAGPIKAVYVLTCVTQPEPGYRKRLMGGPNFVLAREGLFLSELGFENSVVEVRWTLPGGWTLALGQQGRQPFKDTQETLWVAGKLGHLSEESIEGHHFRIGILDDASALHMLPVVEAIKASFRHAWATLGPLAGHEFGVVFFREGSIGGGAALHHTLVAEESLSTAVHEMLHWWTNFSAPAWFREGVHTYLATKLLEKLGIIGREQLAAALDGFLREHELVVKREGRLLSLVESSAAYDRQAGGGDMYGLMPLLAYKLDREIQNASPNSSLDHVFAAVCARPRQSIDVLALIKETTGYDPGPLFKKYFYAKVQNAAELLK